jgi:hypothetical protein
MPQSIQRRTGAHTSPRVDETPWAAAAMSRACGADRSANEVRSEARAHALSLGVLLLVVRVLVGFLIGLGVAFVGLAVALGAKCRGLRSCCGADRGSAAAPIAAERATELPPCSSCDGSSCVSSSCPCFSSGIVPSSWSPVAVIATVRCLCDVVVVAPGPSASGRSPFSRRPTWKQAVIPAVTIRPFRGRRARRETPAWFSWCGRRGWVTLFAWRAPSRASRLPA